MKRRMREGAGGLLILFISYSRLYRSQAGSELHCFIERQNVLYIIISIGYLTNIM